MAEVATNMSAEISTPTKVPKKNKITRPKANHPATGIMVNAAIKDLKERGGSSLQAIKKYIKTTYKIDAEKLSPFIKKYIKNAVASGSLIQTKGKGASGSFKLPVSEKTTKTKSKTSKPKAPEKVAKSTKIAPIKPKSPAKMKKSAKPPTKKPKTPKQKTIKPKTTASKSGKKAAPKK